MLSEAKILQRMVEEMDRVRKLEKMSKSQWARESNMKRSFLSRLCKGVVTEVAWLTLERMARGLGYYVCAFQQMAVDALLQEKTNGRLS